MGSYAVRCYRNTGFDGVNIPDSLSLLNEFEYKDYGSVDIRQERGLSYIRLSGTWTECSDYDYVKVGTDENAFYYSCYPTMIADDVFELTLLPDYILSAGGIEKALANVIGGMTTRFIPSDDTLGYYEESDALLAPALPLNILQEWHSVGGTEITLLDSMLDIVRTGAQTSAKTYTDASGASVTTPTVTHIKQKYGNLMPCPGTTYHLDGVAASTNPATQVYDCDNTTTMTGATLTVEESVAEGLSVMRSLTLESAIIYYYKIPKNFINITYGDTRAVIGQGDTVYTDKVVTAISGTTGTKSTGIAYDYTSQGEGVVWRRILTSEYTKFGLITASGESCEYNPADILETGKPSPSVRWVADPHPDGKPYYRFNSVNSDTSTGPLFFRSCVAGLPWKQIPLVYVGTSGSALNTLKYENSRRITDTNYNNSLASASLQYSQQQETNQFSRDLNTLSTISGIASSAVGLFTGDIGGSISGIANSLMSGIESSQRLLMERNQQTESYNLSLANQESAYRAQKQSELSALAVQNSVSVPTVTIPYNSDIIRDFYGNGFLVYRYVYDGRDIARINKILTMYGYKHTKPVEASDFFNRQNFNYVECSGISVTGLNKTFCQGIAAQLNNGIRIWHVKPDAKYYENKAQNPLKG